jgi:hypothetical protein
LNKLELPSGLVGLFAGTPKKFVGAAVDGVAAPPPNEKAGVDAGAVDPKPNGALLVGAPPNENPIFPPLDGGGTPNPPNAPLLLEEEAVLSKAGAAAPNVKGAGAEGAPPKTLEVVFDVDPKEKAGVGAGAGGGAEKLNAPPGAGDWAGDGVLLANPPKGDEMIFPNGEIGVVDGGAPKNDVLFGGAKDELPNGDGVGAEGVEPNAGVDVVGPKVKDGFG